MKNSAFTTLSFWPKWSLATDINIYRLYKLMIFERKIVRKILGPIRSHSGYWRIKTN